MEKVKVNGEVINYYFEDNYTNEFDDSYEEIILEVDDIKLIKNKNNYMIIADYITNEDVVIDMYVEINIDRACEYMSSWLIHKNEDYTVQLINKFLCDVFDAVEELEDSSDNGISFKAKLLKDLEYIVFDNDDNCIENIVAKGTIVEVAQINDKFFRIEGEELRDLLGEYEGKYVIKEDLFNPLEYSCDDVEQFILSRENEDFEIV